MNHVRQIPFKTAAIMSLMLMGSSSNSSIHAADASRAGTGKRNSPAQLYGQRWHNNLESALAESKQTRRPVLLLRTVGNLAGVM